MRWFLLLLLMACTAGRAPLRPRGLAPVPTTAAALEQALAPRRIAIVIGVDQYEDPVFPALRHAVADASSVSDRLVASGFDQVTRLTSPKDASRDAVIRALREIGATLRPEDTFVLYFSGHGSRVPDQGRWRRFLLTRTSRAGDLEGTALDLQALEDWFGGLAAARKALILDACFSGDGKSAVRPGAAPVVDGAMAARTSRANLDPGEIHLHATSPGRAALEDDTLGHGVYTHHLLEALSWESGAADLDGDRVITAFEAHLYARARTREWTGGAQVPEAILRVVGEADVVLSGDPSREREDGVLIYLLSGDDGGGSSARLLVDGRPRGALPGAVALTPGTHVISVVDQDEHLVFGGRARLQPGESLSLAQLERRVRGSAWALRLAAEGASSKALSLVGARARLGAEAGLETHRRSGVGRGIGAGVALGLAAMPAGDGGRTLLTGRTWFQRRARWRAWVGWIGVGLAADLAPPVEVTRSQADGFYLFSATTELGAGLGLGDELTAFASLRVHGASFDLDGDRRPEAIGWSVAQAGLLWAW